MSKHKNVGIWSQTFTGRKVYLHSLKPSDVDIKDIAHSLAMQCRYTGHTKKFYSVAQHSVLVSELCDRKDALWGLLHDGSETYLGDIARQVKHSAELEGYRKWEKFLTGVIAERFHLCPEEPKSVKVVDKVLLGIECVDLMSPLTPGWSKWINGAKKFAKEKGIQLPFLTNPWSPELSEKNFLDRFYFLAGENA